jgi:DNA-binding CsgD family transcriptional regulator
MFVENMLKTDEDRYAADPHVSTRARYVPCAGDGGFAGRPQMSSLYLREAQVIELFSLGLTSKEISAALGISIHSVNWHRRQALARQRAAMTRVRAPSLRTTSTMSSTSDSVVRQVTIADPKVTTPR